MNDSNDNAFVKLSLFICFGCVLLVVSKPFSKDGIDWSLGKIPKSETEVSYDTWIPATPKEAELGIYEIKVDHGGRGTHQYWKRLKKQ